MRSVVAQGKARVQVCDCKRDWLWVRSPLGKIKIIISINIYRSNSLWCRGITRRWVPPLDAQCLRNSAESWERIVLTLCYLCPPCCVRDTAWSWFIKCTLLFFFCKFSSTCLFVLKVGNSVSPVLMSSLFYFIFYYFSILLLFLKAFLKESYFKTIEKLILLLTKQFKFLTLF